MKKLALFLLALGALGGAGYYWKHLHSPSDETRAPGKAGAGAPSRGLPVKAGVVTTGTVSDQVSAVGTLLANESVMIRPEVDGRIAGIHFSEGQVVHQGERLISLDSSEIKAQLAAVTAEASLAQRRFERGQELHEKKFISSEALDVLRETLSQSLARQAESKAKLAKMTIKAPFEGVAGLRQVSPGAYVKAGQDIARLEGIGTLKVDFRVPEVYLSKIRPRQEIEVRLDAFPVESFRGAIYAVEPAVDEQTRTVLLRAHVPNPGVRLKGGMFARVILVLETRNNALLVPEQAIVPRGRERFVFRIADGKALMTKVDVGLRRPGEVEILKGLSAGETIVVDGQLRLHDGAMVSVMRDERKTLSAESGKQKDEGAKR